MAYTTLAGEDVDALIAFLEELGTREVRHSKRTFFAHLLGTARILERWGAAADVCKAGLFHSIYGTEYFRSPMLPFTARDRVRGLLGQRAERLAYLFCAFERDSAFHAWRSGEPYTVKLLDGGGERVTREELTDLVWMIWANEIEQTERLNVSAEARARSLDAVRGCASLLSAAAAQELQAFYEGNGMTKQTTNASLRTLLNQDPAEFLRTAWPGGLFVSQGPVERLAGLVDFEFDELAAMARHHATAHFRTLDGKASAVDVTPGQERGLYEAGFTIYFHSVHHPRIDEWIHAVDEELGFARGATRVSAFASKRGLGLRPHYDSNDNFVCQARGTKRWRIATNTHVKNPLIGYTIGDPPSPFQEAEAPNGFPAALPEPYRTVDMVPGTVMFVPRGMWHDTETVESASLHFNIQSGLVTWKDVLLFILEGTTLLHGDPYREAIGPLLERGTPERFDEALRARLKVLFDELDDTELDIDRAALYEFVASRRQV